MEDPAREDSEGDLEAEVIVEEAQAEVLKDETRIQKEVTQVIEVIVNQAREENQEEEVLETIMIQILGVIQDQDIILTELQAIQGTEVSRIKRFY